MNTEEISCEVINFPPYESTKESPILYKKIYPELKQLPLTQFPSTKLLLDNFFKQDVIYKEEIKQDVALEEDKFKQDVAYKEAILLELQNSKLNEDQAHLNEFNTLIKTLDDELLHYKKIKNRWTKADSSIKIVCMSITGILSVSTAIISGLGLIATAGTIGIIITSVSGGFGALYLFLTEGVSIGLTSKKKKVYREICECVALGSNKLYLFKMKALSDGIISKEEIDEVKKIIEEIQNEILKIKKLKISKIN